MRDFFRLVVRHGSEPPVTFELEHIAAGYAGAGDHVCIFEDKRGVPVTQNVYDLIGDVSYAQLHGVLYDNARDFTADTEWLRAHFWREVA